MWRRIFITVMLLAGLIAATGQARAPDFVRFIGSYTWNPEHKAIGGLSGLEVAADGQSFVVLGDRGLIARGQFERRAGRIKGVTLDEQHFLTGPNGKRLSGHQADAEGLVLRNDGRVYVSFEGIHRVWAYLSPKAAGQLPRTNDFKNLQGNSGLEALAVDGKNRLYAIPERSGKLTRPFPVWRYAKGAWSKVFSLRRAGGFLPVGADFDPQGRLYLLEREFTGFGFKSRVRRFSLKGDRVSKEEILLTTPVHRHGNLEGIAVWQGADGLRMTMVSDNNFNSFQRTEFVEYAVTQ
ncbi:MAG: esterase-like activity of phytase family protein [Pelagimonas sp.]|jgi:hypothetical protein|nr:esterase-like activity of phytase family protein [Pelagimonas sp.]